jgi:hypothetical protein
MLRCLQLSLTIDWRSVFLYLASRIGVTRLVASCVLCSSIARLWLSFSTLSVLAPYRWLMFLIGKMTLSTVFLTLKSSTIPNSFMVSVPRIRSYCGYSTTSGSAKNPLLEYSKKFSSILALRLVWKIPFKVFHDCGTSLFEQGSSMGLSLFTKTRLPSEPESNRTRTNFCLYL